MHFVQLRGKLKVINFTYSCSSHLYLGESRLSLIDNSDQTDFVDEDVVSFTGKPIVAIVGKPNVGKSTLFNKLIVTQRRKALTSDGKILILVS